jgi:hypothetical protein
MIALKPKPKLIRKLPKLDAWMAEAMEEFIKDEQQGD